MTVLASFNQTRTARRCGAAAVALREHHGGVIAGARRHTDEHSERADPVDRALSCHGSKPASLVKCSGVHGLTGGAGGAVATVLNRRALSCRWRGAHHRRSYRRRRHRLAMRSLCRIEHPDVPSAPRTPTCPGWNCRGCDAVPGLRRGMATVTESHDLF